MLPAEQWLTRGSQMRIELKGVAYKYPGSEHYALKDVSCIFEPGTLTCVVGFNGAGKSTLINLLTRILDSTEGSVDISACMFK